MGIVGNFVFFLGLAMLFSIVLRPGAPTGNVINSLSNLMGNSIRAAKS